MNYESIEKAYLVIRDLPKEQQDVIREVLDYADSCYIDSCEKTCMQKPSKENFKQDVLLMLKTLAQEIENYA